MDANQCQPRTESAEPRHIPPRVSGPHYLITEVDDRFWWRPHGERPVYITPAHWWDR